MNRIARIFGSSTMIIFARTASSTLVMNVQHAQTLLNVTHARQATSGLLQMMLLWALLLQMRQDAAPANQFMDNSVKNAHRQRVH